MDLNRGEEEKATIRFAISDNAKSVPQWNPINLRYARHTVNKISWENHTIAPFHLIFKLLFDCLFVYVSFPLFASCIFLFWTSNDKRLLDRQQQKETEQRLQSYPGEREEEIATKQFAPLKKKKEKKAVKKKRMLEETGNEQQQQQKKTLFSVTSSSAGDKRSVLFRFDAYVPVLLFSFIYFSLPFGSPFFFLICF